MKQSGSIDLATPQQEALLLTNAKQGDINPLTTLINIYTPSIRARARSYNQSDCDDLVQEGLIGFLKAVETYDFSKQVPFKYYALCCATSKINSYLKHCSTLKNKALTDYIPTESLLDDRYWARHALNSTDPSNILILREETEYLNSRILTLLSGFEQDALKLYLSGHSYKEMATLLHTTTKAVDNALQRIRRKLRDS